MSLKQLRDLLSLTQCGLACAAVWGSGGMSWASLLIAAGLAALAFIRPQPAEPSPRSQRIWTLVVAIGLLLSLARIVIRGDVLDAGVDFLLLLVIQRLFQRQRAREHFQLLLLGALLMIVGAVINVGLNYPVLFGGYAVAATMTLLVNHLLAEGERLGPRVRAEMARAGMRSKSTLWRWSGSVSGFVLLSGLAVFLVFPRFGVGVFLRGSFARATVSGFSDTVELGGFGRIKSDPSVIARVHPLDDQGTPPATLDWYFRGTSLDRYDQGRWTQSRMNEPTPLRRIRNYQVLAPHHRPEASSNREYQPPLLPRRIDGFDASQTTSRAEIILEDQGIDLLFLASTPLGVRLRPRGPLERSEVRGGFNDTFHVDKNPGPLSYEFVSRPIQPTPAELAAVGNPPITAELEPYLQRSEAFSPRVRALAERITRGAPNQLDKVRAVMRYLGAFHYSLDLAPVPTDGTDPLEPFLFDTQAGHCEYFATALAVLLRDVGVPTRVVNGYYGAEYNEIGQFYAIRQADAHSWVEVHFGDLGWVTFDATPPNGRTPTFSNWWAGPRHVLDALRHRYLLYVIDFDIDKQVAILERLGVARRARNQRISVSWTTLGAWTTIALLAFGLVTWLRKPRNKIDPPEVSMYRDLLRMFASAGWEKRPNESSLRFARRLADASAPAGAAFLGFAIAYDNVRFGLLTIDEVNLGHHYEKVRQTLH